MAKSSTAILTSFRSRLLALERIRSKQEALLRENHLVVRDIEEVYGAIFVDVVASFEAHLEELFIGLLSQGITSRHPQVGLRVNIRSHLVARQIAFRGKQYYTWLPYENTKDLARLYFVGGRPFSRVTSAQEKTLRRCILTRNAIAHKSRSAKKKFEDEVLGNSSLVPRQRKPKTYLRQQFSLNPPQTYLQRLVAEMLGVFATFC